MKDSFLVRIFLPFCLLLVVSLFQYGCSTKANIAGGINHHYQLADPRLSEDETFSFSGTAALNIWELVEEEPEEDEAEGEEQEGVEQTVSRAVERTAEVNEAAQTKARTNDSQQEKAESVATPEDSPAVIVSEEEDESETELKIEAFNVTAYEASLTTRASFTDKRSGKMIFELGRVLDANKNESSFKWIELEVNLDGSRDVTGTLIYQTRDGFLMNAGVDVELMRDIAQSDFNSTKGFGIRLEVKIDLEKYPELPARILIHSDVEKKDAGRVLQDVFTERASKMIAPGEIFQISLDRMYVRYLEAIDAEVLLYVETTAPDAPDIFTPDRRLVFYKDGQRHSSFLPFAGQPIYGPAPAPDFPFSVRVLLVELDKKDRNQLTQLLNAGSTVSKLSGQYGEAINVGVEVARFIVESNSDDYEFDMTYNFFPTTSQTNKLNHESSILLKMQEQTILSMKDESPVRAVPPEEVVKEGAINYLSFPLDHGRGPVHGSSVGWSNTEEVVGNLRYRNGTLVYVQTTKLMPDHYFNKKRDDYYLFPSGANLIYNTASFVPKLLLSPINRIPLRKGGLSYGDLNYTRRVGQEFKEKTYAVLSVSRAEVSLPNPENIARIAEEQISKILRDTTSTPPPAASADKLKKAVDEFVFSTTVADQIAAEVDDLVAIAKKQAKKAGGDEAKIWKSSKMFASAIEILLHNVNHASADDDSDDKDYWERFVRKQLTKYTAVIDGGVPFSKWKEFNHGASNDVYVINFTNTSHSSGLKDATLKEKGGTANPALVVRWNENSERFQLEYQP